MNNKIHRILEYMCDPSFKNRSSFSSQDLTTAINPQIPLSECNILCRKLIDDGIVLDCTTKDNKGTVCIMRTDQTIDAYNTGIYKKSKKKIFSLIKKIFYVS